MALVPARSPPRIIAVNESPGRPAAGWMAEILGSGVFGASAHNPAVAKTVDAASVLPRMRDTQPGKPSPVYPSIHFYTRFLNTVSSALNKTPGRASFS